jgi:ABC-2 type transport system ATP-binding protein
VIDKGRVVIQGRLTDVIGTHRSLEDAFFALTATEAGSPW